MALYDENGNYLGVQSGSSGGLYSTTGNYLGPQTQLQKKVSFLQGIGSGIENFAKGVGKGALSTIQGLSNLGEQGIKTIYKTTLPQSAQRTLFGNQLNTKDPSIIPENWRTPQGTAQKIGFGAEQVGEFFIPAGEISEATNALSLATDASKLGGFAKGALKLVGRAGIEGAGMGAVSAAQSGDVGQGVKSGVIGGLTMGGLSVTGKAIGSIIGKIPETAWSAILKRTPTQVLKNPNLEKQIAQQGIVGTTKKSIALKAGQAIQNIELSLDDLLSKSDGKISLQAVANHLNKLKTAYSSIPGEESSIKAVDEAYQSLLSKGSQGEAPLNLADRVMIPGKTKVTKIGGVPSINKIVDLREGPNGMVNLKKFTTELSSSKIVKTGALNLKGLQDKTLTVLEANQLKRDIYKIVEKTYGKGLLGVPAKAEAQKTIARGLKEEIEKVIPEVKDLNAKQAIFIQTKKALDKTIARETGKGIGGLGVGLYDLIAGGVGAATFGPAGGVLALGASEASKNPLFLSTVSAGTQKMINYFNGLSPTQKIMFYSGLMGVVGKTSQSK